MTSRYYDDHAQAFFDRTAEVDLSDLRAVFLEHLRDGARILDAGCGSGRDAKAFAALGYQVEGLDASSKLAEMARANAGVPVHVGRLEELDRPNEFDGIWCCAAALHVAQRDILATLDRLHRGLVPRGGYLSFKYGEGEREEDGRRFLDMNEEGMRALIGQLPGVEIVRMWCTDDRRPGRAIKWLNVLARRSR